jgi:hypothetical protein
MDIGGRVTHRCHIFCFDAIEIVPDPALSISDAGDVLEPLRDGVAPDYGMPGLAGGELEDLLVALLIDEAMNRFPA